MQINGLSGMLTEYGEVVGKRRAALTKAISEVLARVADRSVFFAHRYLARVVGRVAALDEQIARIERRIGECKTDSSATTRRTLCRVASFRRV
jgi:transposase